MNDPIVKTLEDGTWLYWLEDSPLWMVAKLEPHPNEPCLWVDFTIYEVQGLEGPKFDLPIYRDKNRRCNDGKQPKSMDRASIHSKGFFKGDGCSEFEFDDTHTCNWKKQEALLGCILECRRVSQRLFDVPQTGQDKCPPQRNDDVR